MHGMEFPTGWELCPSVLGTPGLQQNPIALGVAMHDVLTFGTNSWAVHFRGKLDSCQ
jgi:hypothetical protein